MADEEARFCPNCGEKTKEDDKFCWKCGFKVKKEEGSSNKEKTLMSYKTFAARKAQEKQTFSKKKSTGKTSAKLSTKIIENVSINVGVLHQVNGTLKKQRGSKVIVNVPRNSCMKNVLETAIVKLSNHDQYFCGLDDYVLLCYPDFTLVNKIPGTEETFSLGRYKEELGKAFSKIDLYVCLMTTMLCQKEEEEPGTNNYDDESEQDEQEKLDETTAYVEKSVFKQENSQKKLKVEKAVTKVTRSDTSSADAGRVAEKEVIQIFDDSPTGLPLLFPSLQNVTPVTERFSTCPICNTKFIMSMIEAHVEDCLTKSQTQYSLLQRSLYTERAGTSAEMSECEYLELSSHDDSSQADEEIKETIKEIISTEFVLKTHDKPLAINVSRGSELADFTKFFGKKWNKKVIGRPMNITYVEEAGIDTGGVSREFYSEAFSQAKTQYFKEQTNGWEPAFGIISASDGSLFALGLLFGASLVSQGPGPGFLMPWFYEYIVGGIDYMKLPNSLDNEIYNALYRAETDEDVCKILNTEDGWEILEAVGFRGNPKTVKKDVKDGILRSLFVEKKLSSVIPGVNEIKSGLDFFNVLPTMKKHKEIFRHVFTASNIYSWSYELLCNYLIPSYSEEGSNRKLKEIQVYKSFLDFLEACFKDDSFELAAESLMQYLTGSATVPPLGLPPKMTLSFKHDCKPSGNGVPCRCLPVISTCALSILIPVHIDSEETMKEAFSMSIVAGQGFQRC